MVKAANIYPVCSYCGSSLADTVQGKRLGACPSCRQTYHTECWDANHGCATLGCPANPEPRTFDGSPRPGFVFQNLVNIKDAGTVLTTVGATPSDSIEPVTPLAYGVSRRQSGGRLKVFGVVIMLMVVCAVLWFQRSSLLPDVFNVTDAPSPTPKAQLLESLTPGASTAGATESKSPIQRITPAEASMLPGSASQMFAETGKTVKGIFLDYWNSHGGVLQLGYPISDLLWEVSDLDHQSYIVQYFERSLFEYHPAKQPRFQVLLAQLGSLRYKNQYPSGGEQGQLPNNSVGSMMFKETGRRLGGKFLEYWRDHGGLTLMGFPISDEFTERSEVNGSYYLVQYFERAVLEFHPESDPPYDVLPALLGRFRYTSKYGAK